MKKIFSDSTLSDAESKVCNKTNEDSSDLVQVTEMHDLNTDTGI